MVVEVETVVEEEEEVHQGEVVGVDLEVGDTLYSSAAILHRLLPFS